MRAEEESSSDLAALPPCSSSGVTSRPAFAIVMDSARYSGRCLWFDVRKNYGSIQPDEASCMATESEHAFVFVHGNDVESGAPPRAGEAVEFCRGTCPRGRSKAAHVAVIPSALPSAQQSHGGAAWQQQQQQQRQQHSPQSYGSSGDFGGHQHHAHARRGGGDEHFVVGVSSPRSPSGCAFFGSNGRESTPTRALGRIKWFDGERKQYGFISPADGSPELFVHAGDVLGSTRLLAPGDCVEFDYGVQQQSGRPKALEVCRLVVDRRSDEEAAREAERDVPAFARDAAMFEGQRLAGVVARFDAQHRWGFVQPIDRGFKPAGGGENFFLHCLDVLDLDEGRRPLAQGQRVEFAVVRSHPRRCKAIQCVRVNHDSEFKHIPPGHDEAARDGLACSVSSSVLETAPAVVTEAEDE